MPPHTRSRCPPPKDPGANPLVEIVRKANTIQLVIPKSSPRASNWAPHQFNGTVALQRINDLRPVTYTIPLREVLEEDRLPLGPTDVALTDETVSLVLTERIGKMSYSDVYYVSVRKNGKDTPGLVAKLLDLSFFAPTYENYERTKGMAMKFVADNFLCYKVLEPLQGIHVPCFAGLFAHGTLYCMVFEDAGLPPSGAAKYSRETEQELRDAINAIYKQGVSTLRGDWFGIRRGDDGLLKITDFNDSYSLLNLTPEELKRLNEDTPHEGRTAEETLEGLHDYAMRLVRDCFH